MAAYTHPIGKTRLTTQLNINNLLNKDYFSDSSLFSGGPRLGTCRRADFGHGVVEVGILVYRSHAPAWERR